MFEECSARIANQTSKSMQGVVSDCANEIQTDDYGVME